MGRRRGGGKARFLIAIVMALGAVFAYYTQTTVVENPITGEKQRVSLDPEQEIALGLKAAPQMAAQHGGLHPDQAAQAIVDRVGSRIVQRSDARETGYPFDFHLLADQRTVNAFALPGGQIFITAALAARFETEAELAGVLGHEIGHVVARHSSERLARSQLIQGLSSAAIIAASDPETGQGGQMAALIGNMVNMKYGRDQELESDRLGVRFMADAGYDPRAMMTVMKILGSASAGQRQPEFMSTHPNPENRIGEIERAIREVFPNGVPAGLEGAPDGAR
ncbi:MAG: M48 family metalloprotease [Acidobacteriota bacterium]